RLSVVIPTYRRPELLARCLAAALTQSIDRQAYEVIVVDDGHDDATRAQVEGMQPAGGAPSLRYVRPAQGRGPAVARNAGWRAARGLGPAVPPRPARRRAACRQRHRAAPRAARALGRVPAPAAQRVLRCAALQEASPAVSRADPARAAMGLLRDRGARAGRGA